MPTRKELEDALIAAHEAGDTDSAKMFAGWIDEMPDDAPVAVQPKAAPRDVKAEFDAMPMWQKPFMAASDIGRIAGSSIGMGYSEKALAKIKEAIGSGNYEDNLASERQTTADARTRAGSAGDITSLGAPILTGGALAKAGMTMMPAGAAGLSTLQKLIGGAAVGGIEGGAYGAIDAAGHDQPVVQGAKTGAAFGAGGGAVAEAVGAAANRYVNPKAPVPKAPTIADLADRAHDIRADLADRNVMINPDTIASLNDSIRSNVAEGNRQGARTSRHPAAMTEVERLREYSPSRQDPTTRSRRVVSVADGNTTTTTSRNGNPPVTNDVDTFRRSDVDRRSATYNTEPDQGMSLYDLDQHRQTVRENVGRNNDPAERTQGGRLIDQIDEFARNLNDTTATAARGTVPEAVEQLETARGLDHRRLKAEEVGKMVRKAELSGEAGAGVPTGDKIRTNVANFLTNEKNTMGYSPDELNMLEGIVRGSPSGDRWKRLSEKSRGIMGMTIGGSAGAAAGGYLAGGISGAAAGSAAGTAGSRVLADFAAGRSAKATEKQANELLDTILRGGSKPRQPTPRNVVGPEDTAALRRALMLLGTRGER